MERITLRRKPAAENRIEWQLADPLYRRMKYVSAGIVFDKVIPHDSFQLLHDLNFFLTVAYQQIP